MCIMRTTVAIDDELLVAAKRRARERGETLGQVVEAALRRELAARDPERTAPAVPVHRGGSGPRRGVDLTSNASLQAALDEHLELDDLR